MNQPTWEELQAAGIDPFTADDDVIAQLELAYAQLRKQNLEGEMKHGSDEGTIVEGATSLQARAKKD